MTETTALYITTAMPYVNASPHLGHALELVQADILARHARLRGRPVRLMAGTDEHAIKNSSAARQAGADSVEDFVTKNSRRFRKLSESLGVELDDFIRTTEPRHIRGVEKLWALTADGGDFYQKSYSGLYCSGCEQFVTEEDLVDGICPEHLKPPEELSEKNWFFRLSAYRDRIRELIVSGEVEIVPEKASSVVLAMLDRELEDISVSRPTERTQGWGVPVPGDPSQTVYVWWDALANYLTSAGYGTDEKLYRRWWSQESERVQLMGKGIIKFHAIYWLALLLSAGQPLPSRLYVHHYLIANGHKLSKTTGNTIDPAALIDVYGQDAVRWWLASAPKDADLDFSEERLVAKNNSDLAKGIGNVFNRIVGLRKFAEVAAADTSGIEEVDGLARRIDAALADFDIRRASEELLGAVSAINRVIQAEEPWRLAKSDLARDRERLEQLVASLIRAASVIVEESSSFVPHSAAQMSRLLSTPVDAAHRPFAAYPLLEPAA